MQEKLNADDLKFAEKLLQESSPGLMYNYLSGAGYKYAILALGVAEQNTVAGIVALNFMKAAAATHGKPVDDHKAQEILRAMASEYIKTLKGQIEDEVLATPREVDYKEAWAFHNEVFKNAGYSADAWTLNAVFNVMPEAKREEYWKRVLASAGDAQAELELAADTYVLMHIMLVKGTRVEQQMAAGWIRRIESLENVSAIIELGTVKIAHGIGHQLNNINNFFYGEPAESLHYSTPAPKASPPKNVTPVSPPVPTPSPPSRRRRRRRGRGRPPTTGGGYNNGGHYGGGGDRLTIEH